jgi:hypothetical protein
MKRRIVDTGPRNTLNMQNQAATAGAKNMLKADIAAIVPGADNGA